MRHELRVSRAELAEGLTRLRKTLKRKATLEADLTFEKGAFVFFLHKISMEAIAEGEFAGMVRIGRTQVLNLAQALLTPDPLTQDESRLFIETLSMPCTWHNVEPNPIQLPMDAPLPVLFSMPLKYSDQEIVQSSLSNPLSETVRKRKMLITKAANALEPGSHFRRCRTSG